MTIVRNRRNRRRKKQTKKAIALAPENRSKRRPRGRPFPKGKSANPARQFVPGTSGNAGGRPRTALVSQACREKLGQLVPGDPLERTYAQYLADVYGEKAINGDLSASQELADRAEGRPRISVDASAIVQVSTRDKDLSELSDEELERRIDEKIAERNRDKAAKAALAAATEPAPEAA